MKRLERRKRRHTEVHLALELFLSAVRARQGLDAIAVTTADGLLVAGAGEADVDWIGALGAAAGRDTEDFSGKKLHVSRLQVNRSPMFVTSSGRAADAPIVEAGLSRILGA